MNDYLLRNRTRLRMAAGGFILLLAGAAMGVAEPDFEIPKTHIEVHVGTPPAVMKPDVLPGDARAQEAPPEPAEPVEGLRREVETLRDEMRLLQGTLNLMVNQIMEDMRNENHLLRQEVRRLQYMQDQYGLPDLTGLPRPGVELFNTLRSEPEFPPEEEGILWEGELPPTEEQADVPVAPPEPAPVECIFTPIHEWGRTPEMVEELGDGLTTLKGMVGLTPPGCAREDLEALARDLRKQYDAYENINIEVFDDRGAAEMFIETQQGGEAHRVLSISKHGATGRDVILYLENGTSSEVPLE